MKLYAPQEIADILHISIHTARDWTARGDFGETVNAGRSHLVTQEGLDTYIDSHTSFASKRVVKVSFGRRAKPKKAAKL